MIIEYHNHKGGAKKMTKLQVLKKDNYLSIGGSKGDIFIDQH